MAAAVMDAARITAVLRNLRFPVGTEALLQGAIETGLTDAGVIFEREARLSAADRIDFLCDGGIGIEAKTRCAKRSIYRQLERYAERDSISALILVTGTAMGLPAQINGKPVYFVSLGRCAL